MRWLRKHLFVVAGLVVGGFVVWQVAAGVTLHALTPEAAGTLFGKPVSIQEFLKAKAAATHQAILTHGDRYHRQMTESQIEESAWERLLFLTEARRKGIRVTDREVIQEVEAAPLFQDRQGRFDPRAYKAIIEQSLRASPRIFEEEVREDLMIRKMIDQVVGNPSATAEEVLERFRQDGTSIQAEFLLLPSQELAREVADACRQDPEQLARVARRLEIKLQTPDSFQRGSNLEALGISGLGLHRLFLASPGQADGPFRSSKGWLVARLKEKKVPEGNPADDQRKALEESVRNDKKLQGYVLWYQELLKRAGPKLKKPQERPEA